MKVTGDERERAVLADRARALARVPATPPAGQELLVLAFAAGGEAFAIEAACVREVVRLRQLTPLPGLPAAVRGVTTYAGEILPVVDVRGALGRSAGGLADLLWVIVIGAAGPEFGLLADAVTEVGPIRSSALRPVPAASSERIRRLARGVTDGAAFVLDGSALLADRELFAPHGGTSRETADEPAPAQRTAS